MAYTGTEKEKAYAREYYHKNRAKARKRETEKQAKRYRMVAAIKQAEGCADCGYDEYPEALAFDHLPGSEKVDRVSNMLRGNITKLFDEIAKCEVVCHNCHAVRTTQRRLI